MKPARLRCPSSGSMISSPDGDRSNRFQISRAPASGTHQPAGKDLAGPQRVAWPALKESAIPAHRAGFVFRKFFPVYLRRVVPVPQVLRLLVFLVDAPQIPGAGGARRRHDRCNGKRAQFQEIATLEVNADPDHGLNLRVIGQVSIGAYHSPSTHFQVKRYASTENNRYCSLIPG